jgi:hypothetical protein
VSSALFVLLLPAPYEIAATSTCAASCIPEDEKETGLDNKSSVAFEKHRIRLRMAAGAWRVINTRLPFVPRGPLSYTADTAVPKRTCGAPTSTKSAWRATLFSPSPLVHHRGGTATHETGDPGPLRKGISTLLGLHGLGHGARKMQKARRGSSGVLLIEAATTDHIRGLPGEWRPHAGRGSCSAGGAACKAVAQRVGRPGVAGADGRGTSWVEEVC